MAKVSIAVIVRGEKADARRDCMSGWHLFVFLPLGDARDACQAEPRPEIRPLAMGHETGSAGERIARAGTWRLVTSSKRTLVGFLTFRTTCDFEGRLRVLQGRRASASGITYPAQCASRTYARVDG
jgi:hypothetical protein